MHDISDEVQALLAQPDADPEQHVSVYEARIVDRELTVSAVAYRHTSRSHAQREGFERSSQQRTWSL